MKNNFRKYKFCLVAAFCVAGLYLYLAEPFKITDPTHPRFNPEKFEFTDPGSVEGMIKTIRAMFPIGTDKSYVEHILVEKAGARISQKNDQDKYNKFNYIKKPLTVWSLLYPRVWNIAVDYDENNKIEQVYVNGSKQY